MDLGGREYQKHQCTIGLKMSAPVCNTIQTKIPYTICYVIDEREFVSKCGNCCKVLPAGINKESKQIERLKWLLGDERVLV